MANKSGSGSETKELSDYLETLTMATFKSGLSLKTIQAKWDGFLAAFDNFDVERVASYGDAKIDEMAEDQRIVRSRKKIEATVQNANVMLERAADYDGFVNYLRSVDDFAAKKELLKKDFAYVGDSTAHWFLDAVGENVPDYELSKRKKG